MTTLKVIGYLTIILPLLALLTKAIFRSGAEFEKTFNWEEIDQSKMIGKGLDLNKPHTMRIPHPYAEFRNLQNEEHRTLLPQTLTLRTGFDFITNKILEARRFDWDKEKETEDFNATLDVGGNQTIPAILANFPLNGAFGDLGVEGSWFDYILDTLQSAGVIQDYRVEKTTAYDSRERVHYVVTLPPASDRDDGKERKQA